MSITLIYTKTEKWLISKDEFDWQFWQDKLYGYITSLQFNNIEQCADYLIDDFNLDKKQKLYIITTIKNHKRSTFELYIDVDKLVNIIPLQFNIMQSKGELIDWLEWTYIFTKNVNNFELCVYLGDKREQVIELILNDTQVEKWKNEGNKYILELVNDIQQINSNIYFESINLK
jgi:hypothetical protein